MNYLKSLIPGSIAQDALRGGRKLGNFVTACLDGLTCTPIAYGVAGTALAARVSDDVITPAIAALGSTALYCGGRALLNWYRKL